MLLPACRQASHSDNPPSIDFSAERQRLVEELRAAGIRNPTVLATIGRTPREEFVLAGDVHRAYLDRALPIEHQQTISQPYIVARMTELLEVGPKSRVLEVGTGSGYQAAVLSQLVAEVFSIEIDPALAKMADERLKRLGYDNVHVRSGDGFHGWPEKKPFDAVIITAAAPRVPPAIVEQLGAGGRLVMPLETSAGQVLVRGHKRGATIEIEEIADVIFVPMTGEVRQ